MGNTVDGSTKIMYRTKDNIKIEYIYYDLKGKNRFPPVPADQQQIQNMFQKTLNEINISSQQLQIFKEFNLKYKYRFVVLHQRKVEEYREKNQLNTFRNSKSFDVSPTKIIEKEISKELDQKLKLLENNEAAVKMQIGSIQKLLSAQNKYVQFIKIDGVRRLIHILENAIEANKKGTRTIFQNQIQILKFLKLLSNRIPKEYFLAVSKISDYAIVLLRAYHPINIAVTTYVLLLLQDYSWKVQDSLSLMECLRLFKQENKSSSLLQPFTEAIYHTENILMCCYNLRFINQMLISIVNQKQKRQFQQELRYLRYELIIQDIKSKLQQNYFKIQYCTFIAVSQAIYKHATKSKKEKDNLHQSFTNRSNLKLQTLQHQLLVKVVSDYNQKNQNAIYQQLEDDDQDRKTPVYLAENDKKSFNKFILDTFSQIQHYFQLTLIIDQTVINMKFEEVKENQQKNEKQGLSLQECLKRIKGNFLKNSCEQIVLNCFKALQLFQKNEWKKLEGFINEGLKTNSNINQIQHLKKQIDEKERELQNIKKQFKQYKTEMLIRFQKQNLKNSTVKKLDQGLIQKHMVKNQNLKGLAKLPRPPIPITDSRYLTNEKPKQIESNTSILSSSPPPMPSSNLNSQPKNNSTIPIPSSRGLPNLPPPPLGFINLPSQSIDPSKIPPLPTGIPILPPPPANIPNLPPPPQLGIPNLPPPPLGIPNLPPPLGIPNLPPPPPPPLTNFSLPPIGILNIPAPPPFNGLATLSLPSLLGIAEQKKKPKKQPKVNLKACNYIVLSYQKIKKTIWQKVDDSKITLDQEEIESLFTKPNPTKQSNNGAQSPTLPSQTRKEKIKLLSPDKHRNFQIVLTKLRIPENGIFQALTQCQGKYVLPSILDSINKILPSQEDQMLVNNYDGYLDDLGIPQRFIKEIISVPQYANRIKTLIFANHREEIYYELQSKIQSLTTAFDSLKSNYRLHYILEVALALGNYLNGTGLKGGAWGFRLDTIQNMQQVTSADHKMNAGFYLIKQIWKKYTFPIFDKQEIEMYQHIQKMPTSQVKTDLAQLKKTINTVQKAFNSKIKDNQNDRIDQHCEQLLFQAKQKYAMLEQGVRDMQRAYTECAVFYCQDPNKAPSDQIGKKIFKSVLFIFNTQKVFYELEEKRRKEQYRKAPRIQMKFNEQNAKDKSNPELNAKLLSKTQSILLNVPTPLSIQNNLVEVKAEDKLKELEKDQKDKEKKFLQQMMKKRSNKMMAFKQSRLPNGLRNNERPQQQTNILIGQ